MTDQTEGGSPVSEPQAGQLGKGERGNVQQPSPGQSAEFVTREDFEKFVSELRGLQSKQDKVAQRTDNRLGTVDEQLTRMQELLQAGYTPQQAKRELLVDEMLRQRAGEQEAAPTRREGSRASGSSGVTFDVQEVVTALGYEMNDPVVAKAMFVSKGDEQEFTRQLISETARRRTQTQQPNQAVAPPAQQGAAASPDEQAALRAEYEKLKLNIRPGDVRAITNLQNQFIAKGLKLRG